VELLERIDRTGSIAGAARGMRMSYRQAWLLVDAMNRSFRGGVVEAVHGGAKGGGARLTPTGRLVVARFRLLERSAEARLARELASLRQLLSRT
jgi:molybdate transport system regulatory protein